MSKVARDRASHLVFSFCVCVLLLVQQASGYERRTTFVSLIESLFLSLPAGVPMAFLSSVAGRLSLYIS